MSAWTLADADARARIAGDLEATLFVEAAAGTGKTTALVSRVLALLRAGRASLDRIVAVTFTEKAAGEMKLRLRTEIEKGRADPRVSAAERVRLEQALAHLEVAHIGTIHAFCGDLLHERPIEASVDPLFEVCAEDDSQQILDQVFDDWFQRILADPPPGVRRMLRRRARGPRALGARDALRAALASLAMHRDFAAPWRRERFDREGTIDRLLQRLRPVAALFALAEKPDDWLAQSLEKLARFVEEHDLLERVRASSGEPRDHDGLEQRLRELRQGRHWGWRGYASFRGIARDEVLERRAALHTELEAVVRECDADLAACLHGELLPLIADYEAAKQRQGRLDFLDLLLRARNLVRDDDGVRGELQQRFTHFFVDEFQDTDPLQAELLLLLAAADPRERDFRHVTPVAGKLFLVGDPKQSIYRFRRADVSLYERIKQQLCARGAELVHLTTSFRGTPEIQAAVNAAFEPLMQVQDDGRQAAYVALQPFRAATEERPAVVALPVPRPYGDFGKITDYAIERSLGDAVGAFVHWLVQESGWKVTEREAPEQPVAIQPRHVCILFRRLKSFGEDVSRPYVRALEARRIPHVLVGGRSFHDREEVLALRNALVAIEWPDDALRVFATLRGPLFALADDALLAFQSHAGALHPLRRVESGPLPEPEREVLAALDILGRLHRTRNRRPIAETISRLLDAVRAHAGIAIWPTGEQALANCLRLIDRARRFERRGAPSFRAFVERLEDEAEHAAAEDAPIVEEGTEGVRIMTVHKAKGLEFPVVILADLTCRATREPAQHVDISRGLWAEPLCGAAPRELLDNAPAELARDQAEAVRVAYVAATRARDLLVVPVVGDLEQEGWLDSLNAALYPDPATRRAPRPAPHCPPFGADSVHQPGVNKRFAGGSVAPGLHTSRAGNTIVWWDPAILALDQEESIGLRQDKLLQADASGAIADEGTRAHELWQQGRAATLARAGVPSLRVHTATELSLLEGAPLLPVEIVELAGGRRPHGARFGALVHATLALVDLAAPPASIRAAACNQARLLGSPAPEIDAAASAVEAALRHPLMRRAAAAAARGELRRETPVLLRLPDDALLEGVLDLAFRELHTGAPLWTIVDFKTDSPHGPHRSQYERQVSLYAHSVATATGEPTRAVLLFL